MTNEYVSVSSFAASIGIDERSGRRVLSRALAGHTWRGHQLIVRKVHGKGGRSGSQYQVLVDSLPEELRSACRELVAAEPPPPSLEIDPTPEITNARLEAIQSALRHRSGSSERISEVRRLSAEEWSWPDGKRRRFSERTIRGWIAAYEREGVAGLKIQRRADKGKRRTIISREWDRAVDLDDDAKARIETALLTKVRKFWQSRYAFAGAPRIAELATNDLIGLTQKAGCKLDYARLRIVCRVSKNFVNREIVHRKVAISDYDQKREFNLLPRISRDIGNLAPMQMVMGDEHPLDILVRREDGSTATPKLVAWMDMATNRVSGTIYFFEKGKGVGQEEVIESFMSMVLNDGWGMPGSLYLDNGSAYAWAHLVDDAMQLSCPVYCLNETNDWTTRSAITRAQPYNAPAKGQIEGFFGNFEKRYLSALPGWIGGNRIVKKTANVGREPEPYPGTAQELADDFFRLLHAYNEKPQDQGKLRGLSPNEAFRAADQRDPTRVDVSFETLAGVFCKRESRKVSKNGISFQNEPYYHDALIPLTGERVEIRIPMIRDKSRLLVYRDGEFLCIAIPDERFAYGDPAGPQEAARRKKLRRGYISDLKIGGPALDQREIIAQELSHLPAAPKAKIGARLHLSDDIEAAGRAMLEPPKDPREQAAEEKRQRDENARNMELVANRIRATGGNR